MSVPNSQNIEAKSEPDMLQNDILYTFTINPNDKKQYYHQSRRVKLIVSGVTEFLNTFKDFSEYTLYPEFSTPNATKTKLGPRLHYHGIIKFTNVMEFYKRGYLSLLKWCMFEIDTIEDRSIWKKYCHKNTLIVKPWFESNKIPYKITHQSRLYKVKK